MGADAPPGDRRSSAGCVRCVSSVPTAYAFAECLSSEAGKSANSTRYSAYTPYADEVCNEAGFSLFWLVMTGVLRRN